MNEWNYLYYPFDWWNDRSPSIHRSMWLSDVLLSISFEWVDLHSHGYPGGKDLKSIHLPLYQSNPFELPTAFLLNRWTWAFPFVDIAPVEHLRFDRLLELESSLAALAKQLLTLSSDFLASSSPNFTKAYDAQMQFKVSSSCWIRNSLTWFDMNCTALHCTAHTSTHQHINTFLNQHERPANANANAMASHTR